MSDSHRPDARPEPQSTVQAAGRVAEGVVSGLSAQPMMLAIIVLNIVGILAALWFLNQIVTTAHDRHTQLLKYCLETRGPAPAATPRD